MRDLDGSKKFESEKPEDSLTEGRSQYDMRMPHSLWGSGGQIGDGLRQEAAESKIP